MSGAVETVEVDPTQAVGRLLPEGWRVERTYGYDGGTLLLGPGRFGPIRDVPHGETVTVVVESPNVDTPTPVSERRHADVDPAPLYGLTIQQPYASLIAHGVKTIETRGFQPRVVKPGDDLAIIAGAKRPKDGLRLGSWGVHRSVSGLSYLRAPGARTTYGAVGLTELRLPLGAVVAVARFVEALPIVEGPVGVWPAPSVLCMWPDRSPQYPGPQLLRLIRGYGFDNVSDQLPYGIYRPGRFGWLLDNIRRLPEPIPCTGFQGLRALPADVDAATRQAVQ